LALKTSLWVPDSNLTRVAELVSGERFTPETAFHMEMKLGLPDGFFDQPNPVLTLETIARLKSPLDHIHASADMDHASFGRRRTPCRPRVSMAAPLPYNE
jgi:hypothetical protein